MNSTNFNAFVDNIKAIDRSSFSNEDERQRAIYAARELTQRLERPWDTLINWTWIIPGACFSIRCCLNMGLFHKMEEGGAEPRPVSELAKSVNADEFLVDRLLKHLAACKLVAETGSGVYGRTQFTSELTKRTVGSGIDFLYDMVWPTMSKSPEFFEQNGYKNPTDPSNGPWQYSLKCPDTSFFGWLGANPRIHGNFIDLMSGYTSDRENWAQVYPTENIVSCIKAKADETTNEDSQDKHVVLCDVGGNIGSDLQRFLDKHPEAAGHVLLQDQAEVVKNALQIKGMEIMPHNFFTPQPVRASYFFMHSILHDWADDDCRKILENLKPAFVERPDTKLLLSEAVIPAMNAHPQTTAMDMIMLTHTGALERTEKMWSVLLESAGFKIVQIHPGRIESVVEAILA